MASSPLGRYTEVLLQPASNPYSPTISHIDDVLYVFSQVVRNSAVQECHPSTGSEVGRWEYHFWCELWDIGKALHAEKTLLGRGFAMSEWLELRLITISGNFWWSSG